MPGAIWLILMGLSFFGAAVCGRMDQLGGAMLTSGRQAFDLLLSFGGMVCLWNGVMNIARKSGLTEKITKVIHPVIVLLFPSLRKQNEICEDIAMNMSANFMGLGNAATPAGLRAMEKLSTLTKTETATKEMIKLAVINSASIQFLPMTIASVRMSAGSKTPFDILPAVWLTSVCALAVGLTAVEIFEKVSGGVNEPVRRLSGADYYSDHLRLRARKEGKHI